MVSLNQDLEPKPCSRANICNPQIRFLSRNLGVQQISEELNEQVMLEINTVHHKLALMTFRE